MFLQNKTSTAVIKNYLQVLRHPFGEIHQANESNVGYLQILFFLSMICQELNLIRVLQKLQRSLLFTLQETSF